MSVRAALTCAVVALASACSGDGDREAPAHGVPHDEDGAAARVEISRSTHTVAPEPLAPAGDADAAAAPVSADSPVSGDDETLVGEERERDPRSDTVKIKVVVDERRQAHVIWGRKDFGVAPLEIERPRNSGPLDLVVVTPGYLPLHARAFTDRDDVLSLHLYSAAEAPQLLGYRADAVPARDTGTPSIPNSLQNKGENRTDTKGPGGTRADSHGGNVKTGDGKNHPPGPTTKKQPK